MIQAVYCNECAELVSMAADNGVCVCPRCGTMSIELKENYPAYEGYRDTCINYSEC